MHTDRLAHSGVIVRMARKRGKRRFRWLTWFWVRVRSDRSWWGR